MNTDDIRNIKWSMRPAHNTTLGKILTARELGDALDGIRNIINRNKVQQYSDRLDNIAEDYRLMKDFIKRGFNDPKREEVYNGLLKKAFHLFNDVSMASLKRNTAGLSYYSPYAVANMPLPDMRQRLESFVQETAMLSLNPSTTNTEKKRAIYAEHHELTTAIFYHLLTDLHWNEEKKSFYQELLLSPTIDSNDAQLLTSALLLSLLLVWDARKFATLLYLYQYATDQQVKQRALVGWALTLPREEIMFYPELIEQLRKTISAQAVQSELLELQYQIVYCLNANQTTEEINRDIIPNMLRGQNFFMDKPTDEQNLQDIINPQAEEKAMEELEKSYTRMMNMQKMGMDVYFGGFSQMKRFPFFNKANNWFVPFYAEHPELKPLEGLDESRLEENLFKHSSFCNSDKYSLALAIAMVASQIPAELKNALNTSAVEIQGNIAPDIHNPAYIRRMFLQDLYRFFLLNNLKNDFDNPFIDNGIATHGLFFGNQLLGALGMSPLFSTFGRFLFRKKYWSLLLLFAKSQGLKEDTASDEWTYFRAMAHLHLGNHNKAKQYFAQLAERLPEDEKIAQGLANVCLQTQDFTLAKEVLHRLQLLGTITNAQQLFLSEGLVNEGEAQKACDILFKLHYEQPNNAEVLRLLAKAELQLNKPEAAINHLNQIFENKNSATTEDLFFAAVAHWLVNNMPKALDLFVSFLKEKRFEPDEIRMELNDRLVQLEYLQTVYHRSAIDLNILTDIVADEIEANGSTFTDNF